MNLISYQTRILLIQLYRLNVFMYPVLLCMFCFQSSQTAFQEQHINDPELGDDELFSALNDDMPEGIEGMQDFNDIFSWPETGPGGAQSPTGSPRRGDSPSQPGSPSCGVGGTSDQHSPFPCNASSRVSLLCAKTLYYT